MEKLLSEVLATEYEKLLIPRIMGVYNPSFGKGGAETGRCLEALCSLANLAPPPPGQ